MTTRELMLTVPKDGRNKTMPECPHCGMCTEAPIETSAPLGTCPAPCSVPGWAFEAFAEINRHIEALAALRKDNSYDMLDARKVRKQIIANAQNA